MFVDCAQGWHVYLDLGGLVGTSGFAVLGFEILVFGFVDLVLIVFSGFEFAIWRFWFIGFWVRFAGIAGLREFWFWVGDAIHFLVRLGLI